HAVLLCLCAHASCHGCHRNLDALLNRSYWLDVDRKFTGLLAPSPSPAGKYGSAESFRCWRILPLCSSPGPYSAGTVVLGQPSQVTKRACCSAVASGCTSNGPYLGGSVPNVTVRRCRHSRRATRPAERAPRRND